MRAMTDRQRLISDKLNSSAALPISLQLVADASTAIDSLSQMLFSAGAGAKSIC